MYFQVLFPECRNKSGKSHPGNTQIKPPSKISNEDKYTCEHLTTGSRKATAQADTFLLGCHQGSTPDVLPNHTTQEVFGI
jgi:hypothetical protein